LSYNNNGFHRPDESIATEDEVRVWYAVICW